MKKMIAAAAVLAAGVCLADITSDNIVGYVNKTDVKAGVWTILPVSFEAVGATEIRLDDYVKGTFDKTVSYYDSGWQNSAPQIQLRDAATGKPTFLYYLKDAYVEGGDPEEVPGWADDGGNYLETLTITAGSAFWFYSDVDCSVTFAGQVIGEDTTPLVVYPIWTLIGNGFPQALSLNGDANWKDINDTASYYASGWQNLAPQIQLRDADGKPNFYYYLSDAYDEGGDPEELPGWADDGGNYIKTPIAAGVGFWFTPNASKNVTVEFIK